MNSGRTGREVTTDNALLQLAAIVESCDDAIIGQTLDGLVTSWNAGAERIYGYSAKEAIGRPISLIMPDERKNEMEDILDKIKRGERVDHFETIRVRKDGRKINLSLTVSPIRNKEGKVIGASGVGRDVSDRYELERQREQFLSLASHELKTPVTAIRGFAKLALRQPDVSANPRLFGHLQAIDNQAGLLSRLVEDLLDVSQLESGALSLRVERFDLREVVRESIQNAELVDPRFTYELTCPAEPVLVYADRQLIQEVLANLLDNATKYSGDQRRLQLSVSVEGDEAVTAVRDFGVGIAPEHHSKVFDRFYRATTPGARVRGGLGLGLYISRSIIERNAGRIWFQSAPGAGSTFFFSLPMQRAG